MYNILIVEKKDGVTKITLNRPEKMNAITLGLVSEFKSALKDAESDDTVKAIVVTGAGRAFCAGGDLEYFLATKDSEEFYRYNQACSELFDGIQYGSKVVIAAVNGFCLAGGFELISSCDIVIASENAMLGDEHVNRGLIPGGFSVYRWGRILGPRKATEVLLTGKRYTAKEAEEIGIINKAVPEGKLDEAVNEIVKVITSKSLEALRIGKQALSRAIDIDLRMHTDLSTLAFTVDFTRLVGSGGVKDFVTKQKK